MLYTTSAFFVNIYLVWEYIIYKNPTFMQYLLLTGFFPPLPYSQIIGSR